MLRFLFVVALFFSFNSYGNEIYWSKAVSFSYQFNEEGPNSIKEIIGVPNAHPFGSLNEHAMALPPHFKYGTIEVDFENNLKATHLILLENHDPGKIISVSLFTDFGEEVNVYNASVKEINTPYRTFILSFGQSNYRIKKAKITIQKKFDHHNPQIDAIALADYSSEKSLVADLREDGLSSFKFYYASITSLKKLSTAINSEAGEVKPIITPNGQRLFFTRKNAEDNVGGFDDGGDIYFCDLNSKGEWNPPQNLGEPLNNKFNNGISSISVDGNQMVLMNHYDNDKTYKTGASITHRTPFGWSKPEKLNIRNFKDVYEYADFFVSNDGNVLFLSFAGEDSMGDQDIYVSFKLSDNSWTTPMNLGDRINTPGIEFSPYLASDGETLYFASTNHNSEGGSDIFYSKRLDATWSKWSIPRSVGLLINTPYWESYYSVEATGQYAYFSRSQNLAGDNNDIFRVLLPKIARPKAVTILNGFVFDASNNQPIRALIGYNSGIEIDENTQSYSNPETGGFDLVLNNPKKAKITVKSPGYEPYVESISIDASKANYVTVKKDIYLIPIDNSKYDLPNDIFFEIGGTKVKNSSEKDIDLLIKTLKRDSTLKILLSGHTDNVGDDDLKIQLSEDRANKIKGILIKEGINSTRIDTEGLGDSRLLKNTNDPALRYLNRRVSILVLK